MAMGSLDRTTVTLIPDKLVLTQTLDMPIFRIIDCTLENKTLKTGKQGISMVVVMKRKITSEMMTTYFPSLLLTAITFATTFFKPFFFEAALSVNLTTMLMMTTIFISKMEGLPPTSATKMIDYWLILCQLVPFAQVVLLTAMEYLRENELEKEKKKETVDAINQYDTGNEEEHGPETKEAWALPQMKRSKVTYVLMVIGKSLSYLVRIKMCDNLIPQRKELCHWQSLLPPSSTLGLQHDSTFFFVNIYYGVWRHHLSVYHRALNNTTTENDYNEDEITGRDGLLCDDLLETRGSSTCNLQIPSFFRNSTVHNGK